MAPESEATMLQKVMGTTDNVGVAIVRVILGLVIFPHGAQKMLGWFGGFGVAGTLGFFNSLGIPTALGFCAILAEFLGGLSLIVGFLGRISAVAVAIDMLVAVLIVHLPFGFFMNFGGNQKGEGYEFHLLAIAMALCVLINGSGAASIDRAISAGAARPARQAV